MNTLLFLVDNIRIYTEQDPVCSKLKRRCRRCEEASPAGLAREEAQGGHLQRSLKGLKGKELLHFSIQEDKGERGPAADLQACTA